MCTVGRRRRHRRDWAIEHWINAAQSQRSNAIFYVIQTASVFFFALFSFGQIKTVLAADRRRRSIANGRNASRFARYMIVQTRVLCRLWHVMSSSVCNRMNCALRHHHQWIRSAPHPSRSACRTNKTNGRLRQKRAESGEWWVDASGDNVRI